MSFTIKEISEEGTELVFHSRLDAQVLTNSITKAVAERAPTVLNDVKFPQWAFYDKAKIPVVGFVGNLDVAMAAPNVDVLTWPILTKVRNYRCPILLLTLV